MTYEWMSAFSSSVGKSYWSHFVLQINQQRDISAIWRWPVSVSLSDISHQTLEKFFLKTIFDICGHFMYLYLNLCFQNLSSLFCTAAKQYKKVLMLIQICFLSFNDYLQCKTSLFPCSNFVSWLKLYWIEISETCLTS